MFDPRRRADPPGKIVRAEERAGPSGDYHAATRPRVSVIVLNFNGEKIIANCLDHLLAQNYTDFEILVVDNNSADGSLAVAGRYLGCGKLSIVRASRNLGVAGGRNLGLRYVQGQVIAFIDNDGYADASWLSEAVATLDSDPRIGAVAPVVFFNRNKAILNGAGGIMNYQGYGRDLCFDTPYEYAQLRERVLYPMGCGMVVRREVFDRFGGFDANSVYYYDDTELGIRIWRAGMQVAVSPRSWVDHEFNYSGRFFPNRALSFERARLRVVLKHYPVTRLPQWLFKEAVLVKRLDRPIRRIVLRAWLWTLLHLPSALAMRLKFGLAHNPLWELMEPFWGQFHPQVPNNLVNRPNLAPPQPTLAMDGKDDVRQLNFGWYQPETDGARTFRWSAARASVVFRLVRPVVSCTVAFLGLPSKRDARIVVRALGSLTPLHESGFELSPPGWSWGTFPVHLPAGCYEVLLFCDDEYIDPTGRSLGIAVSSIRFE
jgi:GT2 family glycosyltransferase